MQITIVSDSDGEFEMQGRTQGGVYWVCTWRFRLIFYLEMFCFLTFIYTFLSQWRVPTYFRIYTQFNLYFVTTENVRKI